MVLDHSMNMDIDSLIRNPSTPNQPNIVNIQTPETNPKPKLNLGNVAGVSLFDYEKASDSISEFTVEDKPI